MDEEFDADILKGLNINVPSGPVRPEQLNLDSNLQFRCHKDIACFNACCKNIDIHLTPYDILRLKNRLKISSDEFLEQHTMPFDMDHHGMPGFKMLTKAGTAECQFLTEAGCSVYEDRPAACRYYPVGSMGMRPKDENVIKDIFFLVKEDHCLGHFENKTQTIAEYRRDQAVEIYDEMNKIWREIIIRKRSSGPTIGNPSERSFQLFQMASYELDHFRRFVNSQSFKATFDIDEQTYAELNQNEEQLLRFAMDFLKQILFGENVIALKTGAREERLEKRKPMWDARRKKDVAVHQQNKLGEQDDKT